MWMVGVGDDMFFVEQYDTYCWKLTQVLGIYMNFQICEIQKNKRK